MLCSQKMVCVGPDAADRHMIVIRRSRSINPQFTWNMPLSAVCLRDTHCDCFKSIRAIIKMRVKQAFFRLISNPWTDRETCRRQKHTWQAWPVLLVLQDRELADDEIEGKHTCPLAHHLDSCQCLKTIKIILFQQTYIVLQT